jgi:hypothetical protein
VDKCNVCHNPYSTDCKWNQGRCPNHPPIVKIQPKDTSKGHFYASLIKSALRIVAGACIITSGYVTQQYWLVSGGVLLVGAEILGIVEELV